MFAELCMCVRLYMFYIFHMLHHVPLLLSLWRRNINVRQTSSVYLKTLHHHWCFTPYVFKPLPPRPFLSQSSPGTSATHSWAHTSLLQLFKAVHGQIRPKALGFRLWVVSACRHAFCRFTDKEIVWEWLESVWAWCTNQCRYWCGTTSKLFVFYVVLTPHSDWADFSLMFLNFKKSQCPEDWIRAQLSIFTHFSPKE